MVAAAAPRGMGEEGVVVAEGPSARRPRRSLMAARWAVSGAF